MKIVVNISRIIVGVLFVFSGLIKLNDPIGFSYKLHEYFEPNVLDLRFLMPYALAIAIFVVIFEVVLGVFLLIGYKPKFTVFSLLGMIMFFTFLTFYAAYFDKVKDCGCFGDFLKLIPWQSFKKDFVLLILISVLVLNLRYIKPLLNNFITTTVALLGFICSLWFGYHVLMHLPVWDFRAYKVGANITKGLTVPKDAAKPVQEYTWTFKINNEEKEYITSGSYPDVEGEYLRHEVKVLDEGFKPAIYDFSIEKNGEDHTSDFLNQENLIMIVSYNLASTEIEGLKALKPFTDEALKKGYKVIGLTASGKNESSQIIKDFNLNFDFYLCDEKALKTIVRSNPGILELDKGTIIQKVHWNDIDDLEL